MHRLIMPYGIRALSFSLHCLWKFFWRKRILVNSDAKNEFQIIEMNEPHDQTAPP